MPYKMQPLDQFVAELTRVPPTACYVQSALTHSPSPYPAHPLPDRLPPWLLAMLGACGITRLTPGQAEALDHLHAGRHVLFSAPNGRALIRQLAIFQSIGIDRQGRWWVGDHVLEPGVHAGVGPPAALAGRSLRIAAALLRSC